MGKFKFSWAVAFAAVIMLMYMYPAFLGLIYRYDGNLWKAFGVAMVGVAIVSVCIYLMSSSRLSRNKAKNLLGQILFGIVVLGTFIFYSGPFTSFTQSLISRDEIAKAVDEIKEAASGIDDAYNNYVRKERLDAYRTQLQDQWSANPTLGTGQNIRINNLCYSLERRISPIGLDSIQTSRKEWINNIGEMKILNVKLPNNLTMMQDCVNDWRKEYVSLSSINYDENNYKPFSYDKFDSSLSGLYSRIKSPDISIWVILLDIILSFFIMGPFLVQEKRPIGPDKRY